MQPRHRRITLEREMAGDTRLSDVASDRQLTVQLDGEGCVTRLVDDEPRRGGRGRITHPCSLAGVMPPRPCRRGQFRLSRRHDVRCGR